MKLLPYYIGEDYAGKIIRLQVWALPESWLDILSLSAVFSPEKSLLTEPAEMGLEVEEAYPQLAVCGIETVWFGVPQILPAGTQLVKRPINGADPYYTLLYDYELISLTANNAIGVHPLHIDNYFASHFTVLYATSALGILLSPLPTAAGGYASPIPLDGYPDVMTAVADDEHQAYGDIREELAYYFHEEFRTWEVVNVGTRVNAFAGELPEGHMFLTGCTLHTVDYPYCDTLNGVPSLGFSFNGDFPGAGVLTSLGLWTDFRSGFGALNSSMYLYAEQHGIDPDDIGYSTRPPVIYVTPPYRLLGGASTLPLALARLFLGRR